jgi:hypothetical protein
MAILRFIHLLKIYSILFIFYTHRAAPGPLNKHRDERGKRKKSLAGHISLSLNQPVYLPFV